MTNDYFVNDIIDYVTEAGKLPIVSILWYKSVREASLIILPTVIFYKCGLYLSLTTFSTTLIVFYDSITSVNGLNFTLLAFFKSFSFYFNSTILNLLILVFGNENESFFNFSYGIAFPIVFTLCFLNILSSFNYNWSSNISE